MMVRMLDEITAALSYLLHNPIGGPLVGFILSAILYFYLRRRKLKTHLLAMRAEMAICKERIDTLRTRGVASPLYRFPVVTLQTAFPILLTEGILNEQEALSIGRYFSHLEDLNRGLDNANAHVGDDQRLQMEYKRIILKTDGLTCGKNEHQSVFEAAKAVVDGKILRWRDFL